MNEADRLGLTLLILYPFLLSVSTEGRNFLSIDHRGSSGAGDAPELTRLQAGPQHTIRKEVWLMMKLLAFIIAWLSDIKSVTITIRKN